MALYDNKHWLLSHIRNAFISSDDTGMCEVVMVSENITRQLPQGKYDSYPTVNQEEEEDDDALAQSYEIYLDFQFGLHRHRSNTAQRLERMEEEKKKAADTIHVKWITNPVALTDEERAELFPKKDIIKIREKEQGMKRVSLLTEMLAKCPAMPQNPFQEYAKFDGTAQVGVAVKIMDIFLTVSPSPAVRNKPMRVSVISTAKISDLIGLVCWKCSLEHPDIVLNDSVRHYGLYIAEDDGEVDWDFTCLESKESVAKFGFTYLALVELDPSNPSNHEEPCTSLEDSPQLPIESVTVNKRVQEQQDDISSRMKVNMIAIEAPLFKSYNLYILNKVRAKIEVHLGISDDKVEIDPVVQQRVSSKLWGRQRFVTHLIDSVVACEITENKSNDRATFRLVYGIGNEGSGTFKHHDFEADARMAAEIVMKVNNILDVRPSARRKEYIALRERKSHRRKSFHLGSSFLGNCCNMLF